MDETRSQQSLAGITILSVEDEGLISRMYQKGLSRMGATVIEALNGQQGLDILQQQPIDIVLLDLEMPKMDGFDMLRALREKQELDEMPVIILSNSSLLDDTETQIWLRNMGVVQILLKCGVSLVTLIDLINSALIQKKVTNDQIT